MNDERVLTAGTAVEVLVCPDDLVAITPIPCTVVEVRGFGARLRPVRGSVTWPASGTPIVVSYTPAGWSPVTADTMTMARSGDDTNDVWVNLPALPEHRTHPRRRIDTQAALFPVEPVLTDVTPVLGRLEDVSIGGGCVHLLEAVTPGSRAFLSFRPVQGGLPVRALVDVLACDPAPDGGYLIRTAFRTISEADRGRVAETVLALGATRPEPTVLPTAAATAVSTLPASKTG